MKKKKYKTPGTSSEQVPNIRQNGETVRAKKHLGQHFLKDESIAEKIADSLTLEGYNNILEVGPGMGVLTKYLLQKPVTLYAIEVDKESITYLNSEFNTQIPAETEAKLNILEGDFLHYNIAEIFKDEPFAIIGNFPYNISSQIVFKMIEMRNQVPELAGMFQKEVAVRICQKEGSKAYGIISVLVQAFYNAEFLFEVSEKVFNPPPKVKSGVIRLRRKENHFLPCDEKLFFKVVKMAFQQRRKTLRNSLKTLNLSDNLKEGTIFGKRPEQLSVEEFIALTNKIEKDL